MRRGRGLLTVVLAAALVAGGIALQRLGPREPEPAPPGTITTGAWFCPHGGGDGWSGILEVANPGESEVQARVTSMGSDGSGKPQTLTLAPGTTSRVAVLATDGASASMVEYFGGWMAAGWVLVAGGDESGVAAEPCMPDAGRRFLLPDGTADPDQEAWVVVMNPFGSEAVFSLTILTYQHPPIRNTALTDFVLKPQHSVAFRLNPEWMGTVAGEVDASLGRVAAASLGIASGGGARSVAGTPAGSTGVVLPGGLDDNNASVVVMNPTEENASLSAALLTDDAEQTAAGAQGQGVEAMSARTLDVVTSSPSTIELSSDGPVIAASRRTFGVGGDQGATLGAPGASADWVVLPAVGGPPYDPRLILANPDEVDAEVELSLLGEDGLGESVTVTVPARRTVLAPTDFTASAPLAAVRVHATQGGVVPVFVSYSQDRAGYAVSLGVSVPH